LFASIVVFVVLWWLVFFIALPVGIHTEENQQMGNMKGAPSNPNLKMKIIITSIITLVLTAAFFYAVQHGYFDFVDVRSEVEGG
jgi:predicted secreted protein